MPGFNIQAGGSLDTPNNTSEFHRQHRWIIDDLGDPGSPKERLFAQSVQLPSLIFDEEKIKSGASVTYKIAKKANWQDFTIKFYDVYGLHQLFEIWQRKVWNQESGIGRADAYKKSVKISLVDGQGEKKQTYTAFGAYPKNISHGDLSYTSSDVKLLTVTYSYDFAEIEFKDGKATGGSVSRGGPPSFVLPVGIRANIRAQATNQLRETRNDQILQEAQRQQGGRDNFNKLNSQEQVAAKKDASGDLGFS